MYLKSLRNYFTRQEKLLWIVSVLVNIAAFVIFDGGNYFNLAVSIIGVTSLIFNAKGNPFGQFLMIIFSVMYGIISYSFCYYGEMITYLGMTAPMAVFAFISWLKNPYEKNSSEVKVNSISKPEVLFLLILTCAVTILFYYILNFFGTSNIVPSTLSVATSFLAVYLTFRRSAYYAVCYAANDAVLILLWVLALRVNISYLSVVVCFVVFLVNDIYGFYSWRKMYLRQNQMSK